MTRISAGRLAKLKPSLVCADCEKEVAEAPENEIWVEQSGVYRCPRCAYREGLY